MNRGNELHTYFELENNVLLLRITLFWLRGLRLGVEEFHYSNMLLYPTDLLLKANLLTGCNITRLL